MWLKMQFPGHLVHLQPPTLGGSHPLKSLKWMPRPPYLCTLGCKLSTVGCKLKPNRQSTYVFHCTLQTCHQVQQNNECKLNNFHRFPCATSPTQFGPIVVSHQPFCVGAQVQVSMQMFFL